MCSTFNNNKKHTRYTMSEINFKVLLLRFKSLNDSGPEYISELLQLYTPSRQLQYSSDTCQIPSSLTKSFVQPSFSYQSLSSWNQLPPTIRHGNSFQSFKSSSKCVSNIEIRVKFSCFTNTLLAGNFEIKKLRKEKSVKN